METGWIGQFVDDDLTPLQRSMALAGMREAKDDADARREQAEKTAALQNRREALEFANYQAGDPLGQLSLARSRFSEYDDRCRDLADQLRRAETKRDNAQRNMAFWANRLEPVTQAAQRTDVRDPVELATRRAHEEFNRVTRARRTEAVVSRSASLPKDGGGVVRSEPVSCPHCDAIGASAEESFLLHNDPESRLAADPAPVPDDAERVAPARYAELTR
jgi:hypothetical protein